MTRSLAAVLLTLVVGCSTAAPPPQATAARPDCPSGPDLNVLNEVRGVARDAELWALLFATLPFERGAEVKIVWRMTGSGPLKVSAALPDGTQAKRTFGPEEHGGSTWNRPGDEWGTGFVFPKAGCWRLTLTRTTGSGYVLLPVE